MGRLCSSQNSDVKRGKFDSDMKAARLSVKVRSGRIVKGQTDCASREDLAEGTGWLPRRLGSLEAKIRLCTLLTCWLCSGNGAESLSQPPFCSQP